MTKRNSNKKWRERLCCCVFYGTRYQVFISLIKRYTPTCPASRPSQLKERDLFCSVIRQHLLNYIVSRQYEMKNWMCYYFSCEAWSFCGHPSPTLTACNQKCLPKIIIYFLVLSSTESKFYNPRAAQNYKKQR